MRIFHRMDASGNLTYGDLKTELLHCYGYSEREYQKTFDETILQENETSQQYLGRLSENFRRLFSKAYPRQKITRDTLLNHILRQQFLKGVDRGCRIKLAEKGINDVVEMVEFVDRWRNARKETQENNRSTENATKYEEKKNENRRKYFSSRLAAATGKVETVTIKREESTERKNKKKTVERNADQKMSRKKPQEP